MTATKRRRALIIGALSIIMVMTLGVGYALYTAETTNTGNTTGEAYIVLTPTGASAYSGSFDYEIKYNTVNSNGGITYSLADGQASAVQVGGASLQLIALGDLVIQVDQTGGPTDYRATVERISGTMTGDFYVGYRYSLDGTDWGGSVKAFGTDSDTIDGQNGYLKITLYVSPDFQPANNNSIVQPLDNVSFRITVYSV